jgi:uncharacterized protein YigA (DUF484 family)
MKHSKFVNLDYQSLTDLFKINKSKKLTKIEVKMKDDVKKMIILIQVLKSDFDELEDKLQKVLSYLDENKEVFSRLDELVKDFEQHQVLMNPTIHVARTKDKKLKLNISQLRHFFR